MSSLVSILAFGAVVGMGHAFEADHVAAVSSIVASDAHPRRAIAHGLSWGLGHTLTLLLFTGAAMALGQSIPAGIENRFELAVGFLLVGLGCNLLWRLHRERIHFHGHSHAHAERHFHGHSHRDDVADHRRSRHDHLHRLSPHALVVGMIHGLAGSAALLVLAAAQIDDWRSGVVYIAMFGIGSMLGMGLLSLALCLPLHLAEKRLTGLNRLLQSGLGAMTIFIGSTAIFQHW